jgi:hypothetical protein
VEGVLRLLDQTSRTLKAIFLGCEIPYNNRIYQKVASNQRITRFGTNNPAIFTVEFMDSLKSSVSLAFSHLRHLSCVGAGEALENLLPNLLELEGLELSFSQDAFFSFSSIYSHNLRSLKVQYGDSEVSLDSDELLTLVENCENLK